MNEELVKHQLDTHEKRINEHSKRLDNIERIQAEINIKINNLCDDIKGLTSAIKWLVGIGASALVGFFFYLIQQLIVRGF